MKRFTSFVIMIAMVMPCILDGYNALNTWYEPDVLISVSYRGRRGVWPRKIPVPWSRPSCWSTARRN